MFIATLNQLSSSAYAWNSISKSKSPKISCQLSDIRIQALIDSGAEVNVIDQDIAIQAGIGIANTKETVKAANKLP